jgi:tRNA threonylcarbamoyladenosine biosynthesis protein TsaE
LPDLEFELLLENSEATDALGAALAETFPGAAERSVALYLRGELGTGKTTCVRSLLRTLGVTGLIRSPSYTLIETYVLDRLTCIHVDLYRLHSPLEVAELGLRDFLTAGCLLLVEWPERGAGVLPVADVELSLGYADAGRRCVPQPHTPLGVVWLHDLRHDTRLASYVSNLT